jgi:hypothetical protein
MWMVARIRVAWTTVRRWRALVSDSRRKLWRRDHNPTYAEGAYWL